jgi:hypothetical protein
MQIGNLDLGAMGSPLAGRVPPFRKLGVWPLAGRTFKPANGGPIPEEST